MKPLRLLLHSALPVSAALLLSACGYDRGSRNYDVARYDLDAEYDWQRSRLVANVRITLEPTEDGIESLELDSSVDVQAVRIEGVGAVDYEVQPEKRLWVSLGDVTAKKGSSIVVSIDYEAAPTDNLRPIGTRYGDPITIRTVYSDSEPEGVRQWMPSKDEPADRAIFAVGLRMDPQETAIANGVVMADEPRGSSRYMRYETAYPLPPYLMAFAISEFDVVASKQGNVPVEVWFRKGLPGDHAGMVAELSRMIGEMETLFGPYPFERYALVLLPGHMSGGMENAGITFQRETSSTGPGLSGDLSLAAHELAHQWFGDLVTVKTWDDLWIKEGLATLLAEELMRSHLDANGSGTLNGDEFFVVEGDAIRDPSKPPSQKYDSGPYSRSAWFFTQIRKVLGDEAFFGTLRGLLEQHRMGAIGVDDIVQAFGPSFGPGGEDKLRRALAAKALPQIEQDESSGDYILSDPEGALLTSFDVEWIAANGARRSGTLAVGQPVTLSSASDELRIMDPADVHPDLWDSYSAIDTPEQFARFLELPGIHQANVLQGADGTTMPIDVTSLPTFLNAMHSDSAQALALERACESAIAAGVDGIPEPQWVDALKTAFTTMPKPFGLSALSSYDACSELIDPAQQWPDEWNKLTSGLPNADLSDERLVLLSKFDGDYRDVWPDVLNNAGALRAKVLASGRILTTLENHALFVDWATKIDASELLRSSLLPRLGSTSRKWKTEWENGDAAASAEFGAGLSALTVVLKKDATRPVHAYALCTVRNLLQSYAPKDSNCTDPSFCEYELVLDWAKWRGIVLGLKDAPLSARAAAITNDPSLCD